MDQERNGDIFGVTNCLDTIFSRTKKPAFIHISGIECLKVGSHSEIPIYHDKVILLLGVPCKVAWRSLSV